MSQFYRSLDEQEYLLKQKGYNEESLGSPDRTGYLMHQIENGFSEALIYALVSNQAQNYFVETTGFFNDHLDIVNFRIQYQYDPDKQILQIKSLEANLERESKLFLLEHDELPDSRSVYKLLAEMRRLNTAKRIINHTRSSREFRSFKPKR